jgi:menaquinone-dependent protoporphyrinogen oxidase
MPTTKISRRDFLKVAGITLGASAVACSGLTVLGTRQPDIDFTETTFGDTTLPNKILVTYASKAGSTGDVAEAIGKTLAESGAQVDVRLMKDVNDLTPYRAVVAGSAIRRGRWLQDAMHFVETYQAPLAQKPFAAFLVCMTLAHSTTDASRQEVAAYLEPVRALVKPASEGLFAGALDYSKLTMIDGLMMRAVGGDQPGDYRDWNAIRAWATDLKPVLAG